MVNPSGTPSLFEDGRRLIGHDKNNEGIWAQIISVRAAAATARRTQRAAHNTLLLSKESDRVRVVSKQEIGEIQWIPELARLTRESNKVYEKRRKELLASWAEDDINYVDLPILPNDDEDAGLGDVEDESEQDSEPRVCKTVEMGSSDDEDDDDEEEDEGSGVEGHDNLPQTSGSKRKTVSDTSSSPGFLHKKRRVNAPWIKTKDNNVMDERRLARILHGSFLKLSNMLGLDEESVKDNDDNDNIDNSNENDNSSNNSDGGGSESPNVPWSCARILRDLKRLARERDAAVEAEAEASKKLREMKMVEEYSSGRMNYNKAYDNAHIVCMAVVNRLGINVPATVLSEALLHAQRLNCGPFDTPIFKTWETSWYTSKQGERVRLSNSAAVEDEMRWRSNYTAAFGGNEYEEDEAGDKNEEVGQNDEEAAQINEEAGQNDEVIPENDEEDVAMGEDEEEL